MSTRINYEIGSIIGYCIYLKDLDKEEYYKPHTKFLKRKALFRCNCGKEFKANIDSVKRCEIKSCGCLQKKAMQIIGIKKITHGKSYHPIFHIWSGIKHRCENIKDIGYYLYGGRGIKICDRWQDVNNFIEDMYPSYKKGLDIDRTNNNGNYELSNCKWVTRKQNCNNRRSNRIVEYKGMKKNITEWTEYLGIRKSVLTYRVNHWEDIDKIFTQLPRQTNRTRI